MSQTALTYRDYEALPDDGRRYEIHDGQLSVTPAPSLDHQIVSMRLIAVLLPATAAANGLLLHAPLDVILADTPRHTSITQPDLVYLAEDRRPRASPRGIEGAPTLVVEILSPHARPRDEASPLRAPSDALPVAGRPRCPDCRGLRFRARSLRPRRQRDRF